MRSHNPVIIVHHVHRAILIHVEETPGDHRLRNDGHLDDLEATVEAQAAVPDIVGERE